MITRTGIGRSSHVGVLAGSGTFTSAGTKDLRNGSIESGIILAGNGAITKQAIGTVLTGDDGAVAHIEVWKITADGLVNVDPAGWIFR